MLASRARKLVDPDDEFNGLGTNGEIAYGLVFRAAMDGITTAVTVRAEAQSGGGNESQAHGVSRCVVTNMYDLEAVQTKQLCPKLELSFLAHNLSSLPVTG